MALVVELRKLQLQVATEIVGHSHPSQIGIQANQIAGNTEINCSAMLYRRTTNEDVLFLYNFVILC